MCECVCRDGTVEPLDPPASSSAGDRVYVDGYQHDIAGGTHIQSSMKGRNTRDSKQMISLLT